MRIKTLGFETGDLAIGVEIYNKLGSPLIVTGSDAISGNYACKMRLVSAGGGGDGIDGGSVGAFGIGGAGIGGGMGASDPAAESDFISLQGTTLNGAGYFKTAIKATFPNLPHCFVAFKRESDSLNMAGIEIQPDGRLQLFYRNDAGDRTDLGNPTDPLVEGQEYDIELGIIGNAVGTNRYFEARVNEIQVASANVADQSAYNGFWGFGYNLDYTDGASTGYIIFDDIAINDGSPTNPDGSISDQNSWPGHGKMVRWTVTGDDTLGNTGWARAGVDSGSDYGQVNELDPDDATSYLSATTDGKAIDLRCTNPYDLGIKREDTIKVVAAQIRARGSDATSGSTLSVYLRAGSNLPKQAVNVTVFDVGWHSGDADQNQVEVLALTRMPQSTHVWTTDELASLRFGMETVETDPDIYVSAVWGYIEYAPYTSPQEISLLIGGTERITDARKKTLKITDEVNEKVNTASVDLYDEHSHGAPSTDDVMEVRTNGVLDFAGLVTRVTYTQLSNTADIFSVQAVDYTRILDRRLVAATYQNMTDKAIIEAIISEFAGDEGIGTYHVSEGVTINQISFNYIPVSQALTQIANLTGRNWFIDYEKDIHYFPLEQNAAPFSITSNSAHHDRLVVNKDATRLRNRVFVRGGTELTSAPVTETIVADGDQRQFLLAEKPHDLTLEVNGVPKTVGIKNIDDPADFDYMLSFQEKYVENGSGTATLSAGDTLEFTYNYDVPILVSVEDNTSIAESGVYEFVVIDKQIASTQQARDRASADLTDYANDLVDATYYTMTPGMRSGQYQRVTMANKGIDEDYIVNRVVATSIGGGFLQYQVFLSNAKTLGIIKFLIQLLQVNRTVGDFDPNEQVDQLFSVSDQLDSIIDSLTIDSQGLGFPWAPDSGAPATSLKWDLGQWS